MLVAKDGTVPEPTPEFPYVGINPRTGTWARSCVPLYEKDWTDIPWLHWVWSYWYTGRRIIKAYAWVLKTTWKKMTRGNFA